jgi:hypothetical protein
MLIRTFTTDRSHCSIFFASYASLYPEQPRVLLGVEKCARADMIFDFVYPTIITVSKKGSTCLKNIRICIAWVTNILKPKTYNMYHQF